MTRVKWASEESKNRGLRANEIVIFTYGSYSDYTMLRVVQTTRYISAEEIESASQRTILRSQGTAQALCYLYEGDLIETLLSEGLFKEVNACELHNEETRFSTDVGGPSITFAMHDFE